MATPKAAKAAKTTKRKTKKNVPAGNVHIKCGFGNTIVMITDVEGNSVAWSSAGHLGFKGSRKGTPFAAQVAAEDAAKKAMDNGMRTCAILLKGPGAGREPAVRAIAAAGLKVTSMRDITPVPHNGCRPPKRRRV